LKNFNKYFKVLDHFLEVKVAGKRVRIKMDIEGKSDNRLVIKETEFLYPVGSDYCKMFRVIEKKTKQIFTAKRVTICSLTN
jgi:hypothetical protein